MEEQPYFMNPNVGDLGKYVIEDEMLHPQFESKGGSALTETHFFGFSVPEAAIHSILYAWHHPNLRSVSGGVHVFQGVKSHSPGAEIADHRHFMSDAALRKTFPNYSLDMGYRVEMLEPGMKFRTTYNDESRTSSLDVIHTAVSEPLVWPGDKHFEQVMRTKGELVLRGKPYRIDGYHVRDRSWGQPRPEDPFRAPPHSWVTGVFDDETALHLTAADDPARDPAWRNIFPDFDPAQCVKFGWMILKGRKTSLRSASKLTTYDRTTLMPTSIDINLIDEHGDSHHIKGTLVAGTPVHFWHNTRIPICLARWQYNGRIGWGDIQDVQYPDFVLDNC